MRHLFYTSCLVLCTLASACQTTQSRTDRALEATKSILTSSGQAVRITGKKSGELLKSAGEKSADLAKNVSESEAVKKITLSPAAKDVEKTGKKHSLGEAALSPLNDTNIRRAAIPERLLALDGPYDQILDGSCEGLLTEMLALTSIVGPELDAKSPDETMVSKGARAIRSTSFELTEAAATSFIPFRSVVRFASGATKYEKKVRREYRKGIARRAYLYGVAESKNCNTVS